MAIKVVTEFLDNATVRTVVYVKDDDDALTASTAVNIKVFDPAGLQKCGNISVVASASFTADLIVTGGTSGATGYIASKPDATTLELREITGTFVSGETVTDSGAGTSTTTSALLGIDIITSGLVEAGIYEYYYHMGADSLAMDTGRWRGEIAVVDGVGADAITSPGSFAFKVR